MRIQLLCLLLSVTFCSQAAIYKWVDSRGEVHYSDTPTRDAEKIELSDPTIYTPSGPGNRTDNEPVDRPTAPRTGSSLPYASFVILSPGRNEQVQANDGRVTIRFSSQPSLQEGHYIQAILDGRILDQRLYQGTLLLENVERGAHMIHASIHDAAGRLMARSNIVQFFVRQTSVVEDGKSPQPPPSGSGSNGGDAPQFKPESDGDAFKPGEGTDFDAGSSSGQTHQDFGSSSKPIPRSQGTSPAFKPNY
ncbi:MAG: DUF4124 domain-containing protein [Sedimenticola sp.]|nr:DUF4124 domain-containing protein [Sedimenticola sp.]